MCKLIGSFLEAHPIMPSDTLQRLLRREQVHAISCRQHGAHVSFRIIEICWLQPHSEKDLEHQFFLESTE